MDSLLVSMNLLNHLLLCTRACTVSPLLSWLGQAFLSATASGADQGLCAQEEMENMEFCSGTGKKPLFKVNNLFTLVPGSEHLLMAHAACLVFEELGL